MTRGTGFAATAFVGFVAVCRIGASDTSKEAYFASEMRIDLPVIVLTAGFWIASDIRDRSRTSDLCDPFCDPSTVNAWDRTVIGNHNAGAKAASDALVTVLPMQSLWLVVTDFLRLGGDEGVADAVVLTETLAVSGALNQAVKVLTARPRPYMYRAEADDGLRLNTGDDYRSFYSSHTSSVFAVLTATAFIFSKRNPKSPLRPLVWALAVSAGATLGVLRVAAGKHFYTDVLSGAAIGTAVGLLIPALHFKRRHRRRSISFYPSGGGLAADF